MILRSVQLFIVLYSSSVFGQYSGEICTVERTSAHGICKNVFDCPAVISEIAKHQYTRCGFQERNEIVCCPEPIARTTTTRAPEINANSPISQQKCKEYSDAVFEDLYSLSLALDEHRTKIKIDKCGHKVVPLIVGGEHAKPREFPHMALVGFDIGNNSASWLCGGALISDQYVLTAGHCLHSHALGDPKYIRLGELNLLSEDDDARPENYNISQIIPYTEYTAKSKYNDLGLLKMDRKVKLNPYIRPICLPTASNGHEKEVIATGWGHTQRHGEGSSHMLKVTLIQFTQAECNATYEINRRLADGIREDIQICAGSKTEQRDTCQGDSGGPIQVFHPSEYCMYTIVGVTSFGKKCGNVNVPGVYTRVFPYIGWIEGVVWGNN